MHTATVIETGQAAAPGNELVSKLEIGPPERVAVGRGNAFVVAGYCHHPRARTASVSLELDGERVEAIQSGMPRQDVYEDALPEEAESAFHSGFLAIVPVRPRSEPGEAELQLIAGLADGSAAIAPAGRVRLDPGLETPEHDPPVFPDTGGPRVTICLASFEPPPELLHRQIESIRSQTHGNWVCVVSDDGSSPERLAGLIDEIGEDPRFAVATNADRAGFYNNFERTLAMTPAETEFVTLCDQDDHWHPDKLDRLLERMTPGVQLAYSDARVVAEDGTVVHPSYWVKRRNNYSNLGSLLIANTVTGAASLFRRDLLEDLLPFPPKLEVPYHDHWLSLVALARGEISYVDDPLYDYVQHPDAVIGHSGANRNRKPVRERIRDRLTRPGDGSRIIYFYTWSQLQIFAEVLRMRCFERMEPAKRRALDRFLSADTSLTGLGWLLGRRVRRLWGRNETLDIERHFGKALLRRRAVSLRALGRRRPARLLPRDQRVPPYPTEGRTRGS